MNFDPMEGSAMAYQQIDTILDHAEKYHHRVARLYGDLAEICSHERVRMLLASLADHERKVAGSVSRYRSESSGRVLSTWVTTDTATSRLVAAIDAERIDPEKLAEGELVDLALRIDDRVIEVYEEVARRDTPPWVVEAFQELLRMERSHEMLLATQVARGGDL